MPTEADTCREYITPALQRAGWDRPPHSIAEQRTFTDGQIVVAGKKAHRRQPKRADYILRHTRDIPIAVVEAKVETKPAGSGMQQAKEYAQILGLHFAYATNGLEIVEYDAFTGEERVLGAFPTPAELWARQQAGLGLSDAQAGQGVLEPMHLLGGRTPRYYQEIAINRSVQAITQGKRRVLLTMATGTGKTFVAFQICWKLWSARWNRTGEHRRPKILYLSDRNFLVDDPKDKDFAPFGDARFKIASGKISKSREIYFAIYQAIAEDEARPGLYREYRPDFFDLIIVDECHRGSARDESRWREILEYFEPACQLGMTATPLREDTRNSYAYFGAPIYTYSLRQGIEDGFLAPYRVHRIVTSYDAGGWRPSKGDRDRFGREIPDEEYHTKDFERAIALRSRTQAIAHHLTEFLRKTDRFAKTIVFCVDQEHADEMRRALNNLNADLVKRFPDYVARVTADDGDRGRGFLGNFREPERTTPAILTTSQLLTTGLDVPTCTNVVIARVVGSMPEFKQIIGRGTRVRDDYGKLFFNILDYTGSATAHFADPEFDGFPVDTVVQHLDPSGNPAEPAEPAKTGTKQFAESDTTGGYGGPIISGDEETERRKFYFDGGQAEIVQHMVHELDPDGHQLRVVHYADYTADKVRTLYHSAAEVRSGWANTAERQTMIQALQERGIDFDELRTILAQPDADPLDLLCHLAFNAPLRTRRERAERLRREQQDFFDRYGPEARAVLQELLDKYAEHGTDEFAIPDVLKVPPISGHGNVLEIAQLFGGPVELRRAVDELQNLLYAA